MPDTSAEIARPSSDCRLCPRLAAYRHDLREEQPDWFNAPVPSFGDAGAWLAIVGLAPGLKGANRTGRPFTGDSAGGLLYETLGRAGLARGSYSGAADDDMRLEGAIILNAVRCVPPQNRPTTQEIAACGRFLRPELDGLFNLKVIVALGTIAHGSVLRAYGETLAHHKFGHAAEHAIPDGPLLLDSYHCSRLNTNTGRLTPAMFDTVFARAREMRG
ncbi:uracil-DNA glycosylase [Parasphingopyxis marina]|uniref:Type-5 uracil-DNA glycosylase n=1 Tax=Parasphingopyxis marina TaxID=2761622 RepID=A0A842HZX8_9SPHN|nr:uracil-DNA glycosylase [Parasphingopyxis marina]MBC2777490.1 uracil-DNA glycosylase [Parasphingopyxis marina]